MTRASDPRGTISRHCFLGFQQRGPGGKTPAGDKAGEGIGQTGRARAVSSATGSTRPPRGRPGNCKLLLVRPVRPDSNASAPANGHETAESQPGSLPALRDPSHRKLHLHWVPEESRSSRAPRSVPPLNDLGSPVKN